MLPIRPLPLVAALMLIAGLLAPSPLSAAAAPDEIQKIRAEYDDAMQKFSEAYRKAGDDAARQRLMNEYPQPAPYVTRIMEAVRRNPKSEGAIDGLVWVASNGREPASSQEALDLLLRDHATSDKIGSVCLALTYSYSGSNREEKFLRAILAKNPHKAVQGTATFALAQVLNRQESSQTEAEKLFEKCVDAFADVAGWRGTLGELAKAQLFEIRNLAIGKVAPDIEGEDVDGRKFKLSDYRGKVVVIDFWGDW